MAVWYTPALLLECSIRNENQEAEEGEQEASLKPTKAAAGALTYLTDHGHLSSLLDEYNKS